MSDITNKRLLLRLEQGPPQYSGKTFEDLIDLVYGPGDEHGAHETLDDAEDQCEN